MRLPKAACGGLLAFASLIWGTAFVAQALGMDYLGPCTFNAARSFLGSAAVLLVVFVRDGLRQEKGLLWSWKNPDLLKGGALCGVFLAAASMLQQAGLQYIGTGKAGFMTSLYIVIVPVLGVFFGRRGGVQLWAAVGLALFGVYFLSVKAGTSLGGIGLGECLVLLSAAFFSIHILIIDRFSPRVDCVKLSCLQFFVAGIISSVAAAALEGDSFSFKALADSMGPLLYTGIMSSGVAYTLQIVGQKGLEPTAASLLMSLESVFSAVSGWLILSQPMSGREIFGSALVFCGVVLAQLPGRKDRGGAGESGA